MATRNVDVGAVPVNIVATLSLTVGVTYTLENVDANARIFVRDAAVMPTVASGSLRGHVLPPGALGYYSPDGVTGVWLWTDAPIAKAVITEA